MSQVVACIYKFYLHLLRKCFLWKCPWSFPRSMSQIDAFHTTLLWLFWKQYYQQIQNLRHLNCFFNNFLCKILLFTVFISKGNNGLEFIPFVLNTKSLKHLYLHFWENSFKTSRFIHGYSLESSFIRGINIGVNHLHKWLLNKKYASPNQIHF